MWPNDAVDDWGGGWGRGLGGLGRSLWIADDVDDITRITRRRLMLAAIGAGGVGVLTLVVDCRGC